MQQLEEKIWSEDGKVDLILKSIKVERERYDKSDANASITYLIEWSNYLNQDFHTDDDMAKQSLGKVKKLDDIMSLEYDARNSRRSSLLGIIFGTAILFSGMSTALHIVSGQNDPGTNTALMIKLVASSVLYIFAGYKHLKAQTNDPLFTELSYKQNSLPWIKAVRTIKENEKYRTQVKQWV